MKTNVRIVAWLVGFVSLLFLAFCLTPSAHAQAISGEAVSVQKGATVSSYFYRFYQNYDGGLQQFCADFIALNGERKGFTRLLGHEREGCRADGFRRLPSNTFWFFPSSEKDALTQAVEVAREENERLQNEKEAVLLENERLRKSLGLVTRENIEAQDKLHEQLENRIKESNALKQAVSNLEWMLLSTLTLLTIAMLSLLVLLLVWSRKSRRHEQRRRVLQAIAEPFVVSDGMVTKVRSYAPLNECFEEGVLWLVRHPTKDGEVLLPWTGYEGVKSENIEYRIRRRFRDVPPNEVMVKKT